MKKITSQVKSISRVFAFAPKKILFAFMLMVIITMTSFAQRAMEVKLTGDGLIANPMTLVEYQNQTALLQYAKDNHITYLIFYPQGRREADALKCVQGLRDFCSL